MLTNYCIAVVCRDFLKKEFLKKVGVYLYLNIMDLDMFLVSFY